MSSDYKCKGKGKHRLIIWVFYPVYYGILTDLFNYLDFFH